MPLIVSADKLLLFAGRLGLLVGDELLSSERRNFLVVIELHGESALSLSDRLEIDSILLDLAHGDLGFDVVHIAGRIHTVDTGSFGIEIGEDITGEVVGDLDIDKHDRFKDDGMSFGKTLLKSLGSGDLETDF